MIARRTVLAGLACLPVTAIASPAPAGFVERLSPRFDALVPPSAKVERVATGFRWAEGPVWVTQGDYLLFSDPPANIVYRWHAKDGVRPFLSPAGFQGKIPPTVREAGLNGMAIGLSGRLLAADSGTRAIVEIDLATRKRRILADRFDRKRFNSPNDLCVAPSGIIYFTDPTYGLADGDTSPLRELDHNGLYALLPDGKVILLDGGHKRPNGVAITPDGRTLYVTLSDESQPEVRAYRLGDDGMPTGQHLFCDMRADLARGRPGLPDGIKVIRDGHVIATGPGGVHVLSQEGERLGIIGTGKAVANCCLGKDGASLFLTSSDSLAVIPFNAYR